MKPDKNKPTFNVGYSSTNDRMELELSVDTFGPFTKILAAFYVEDATAYAEFGKHRLEWVSLKERVDAFFQDELARPVS